MSTRVELWPKYLSYCTLCRYRGNDKIKLSIFVTSSNESAQIKANVLILTLKIDYSHLNFTITQWVHRKHSSKFNWQERTLIQLKICFFSVRLHHKRINHFCFFFCAISWIRSFNLSDDTIKVAQKDKNLWSNCSSGGAKNEIVGFSGSSHL